MAFGIKQNPDTNDYKDILQLANNAQGLNASTLVVIKDGAGNSTPLQVSQNNFAFTNGATLAEINNMCDVSARLVNLTAATLTLSDALHGGNKIVTVNKADGTAITLPAASGSGASFRLFIGTTITSVGTTIKVANASDTMVGFIYTTQDAGDTALLFEVGGTNDTITLNGSTTGGIKGDWIELVDIATNLWLVRGQLSGTGTEATPMSATV